MANHSRRTVAPIVGISSERSGAAHMVEVAMGVDERVERFGAPCSGGRNNGRTLAFDAGVKRNQARAGIDQHRMAERLNDGNTFSEFADLFGHTVHGSVGGARVNDPGGQVNWMFAHPISFAH